jgi:hypothetical protein
MAKTVKQIPKKEEQPPVTEKRPSKRIKDHDIFMRGLFDFVQFASKILQYAVPADLKPYIDFSTLKIMPDTHISSRLAISQSDTIYEAALNQDMLPEAVRADKKLPNFRFCFVGEFKSGKTKLPVDFQVDSYVKSQQRKDIINDRPPSIVVPLLFYHGATPWENKRLYDLFSPYLPKTILNYIAHPQYLVIDLQVMTDELIKNAEDLGELRAAFLALKHAHEKEFFVDNITEMLKFVDETPTTLLMEEFMSMLMEYMQRRSKLDDKEFNEIVEQSKTNSDMVKEANGWKIYLKKTKDEGFNEGIALSKQEIETAKLKIEEERLKVEEANKKAEEERLKAEEANKKAVIGFIQNTRFKDAQIADILDLPIAFVEAIRKELKKISKSPKKTKVVSPPQ